MKNIAKLFTLTLAVAVMFTSCDMSNSKTTAANNKISMDGTRGVDMVNLQGSQVSISKTDVINVTKAANAAQDDDAIKGIMRSLMGAENIAQQLDVKFHMNDEPVEEGLFVFGIEAEEEKSLTMEMFDEEGFEMAANNVINITQGNNYKALNVKSLEDGKYFFKLKDDAGKELVREVTISHKN